MLWWLHIFLNIGEAANPGPSVWSKPIKPDELFYVESTNVTHLGNNIPELMERRAGIQIIQEHSIAADRQWIVKKILKSCGKKIQMSGLDEYADHNLGGVATITGTSNAIGAVEGQSPKYREATKTGRCAVTVVAINSATQIAIGNIYGYTGGHGNRKQLG